MILLVASALFGVLTYGLNTKGPLDPTPEPGSTGRTERVTLARDPARVVLTNSTNQVEQILQAPLSYDKGGVFRRQQHEQSCGG